VAFREIRLENGGFLVTLFKGAFLNWSRWIFAFALPVVLSACMGTCNCHDGGAPHWSKSFQLTYDSREVNPQASCTATMTRGSNVITMKTSSRDSCDETHAGAQVDGGVQDGFESYCAVFLDDYQHLVANFQLGAADESYLGDLNFTLDLTCDDGTTAHEDDSFSTQVCEE
jgi:hypothetical protein